MQVILDNLGPAVYLAYFMLGGAVLLLACAALGLTLVGLGVGVMRVCMALTDWKDFRKAGAAKKALEERALQALIVRDGPSPRARRVRQSFWVLVALLGLVLTKALEDLCAWGWGKGTNLLLERAGAVRDEILRVVNWVGTLSDVPRNAVIYGAFALASVAVTLTTIYTYKGLWALLPRLAYRWPAGVVSALVRKLSPGPLCQAVLEALATHSVPTAGVVQSGAVLLRLPCDPGRRSHKTLDVLLFGTPANSLFSKGEKKRILGKVLPALRAHDGRVREESTAIALSSLADFKKSQTR